MGDLISHTAKRRKIAVRITNTCWTQSKSGFIETLVEYALVEPYSYRTPRAFHVPPPFNSNHRHRTAYKQQADEVLDASANLTEEQKLKAELFDNKINSLGFSAVFAANSQDLSLLEFIQLDFLTNMAAFDARIFVWKEKMKT